MAAHSIRDNTNLSQVRYRFLAGKIPRGTRTVDEAGLNGYSERIPRPDFFQRNGKIEKGHRVSLGCVGSARRGENLWPC
jgi:hypothetical protein